MCVLLTDALGECARQCGRKSIAQYTVCVCVYLGITPFTVLPTNHHSMCIGRVCRARVCCVDVYICRTALVRMYCYSLSLKVLSETDDVIHPLLFAAETKNPRIVQISLASLQKLIQYKAIPQVCDVMYMYL